MSDNQGIVLSDFEVIFPAHRVEQEDAAKWTATAHTMAKLQQDAATEQPAEFQEVFASMARRTRRFGCPPSKIAHRYFAPDDLSHEDWDSMGIYNYNNATNGAGTQARMSAYASIANEILSRFYDKGADAPSDLIHVSCTGYVSPSAGQKLVSQRGWLNETTVTHAYHMGCYASIPAIRIAAGALASPTMVGGQAPKHRSDVVHTELCSLHMNAQAHTPEQFVIQSLFADGFIKYSAYPMDEFSGSERPGLKILAIQEEIVPNTEDAMTWVVSDYGMDMTLHRSIPRFIADELGSFVVRLFERAGYDFEKDASRAHWAVHPGGPKIIESVQKLLGLADTQVQVSKQILQEHGNMSSATLPHIWAELLRNGTTKPGELVVGLAFGPGLTICGILFERV